MPTNSQLHLIRFSSSRPEKSLQINPSAEFAKSLRDLQQMPTAQFSATIIRLIKKMGYAQVSPMKSKLGRGRSDHGGFDLIAHLPNDLTNSSLIAQAKQYEIPVSRAFVDEIRGAMIRTGARHGLLVTTSTFSQAAQEAAASVQRSFPVRLIGGLELARLLDHFGILQGTAELKSTTENSKSAKQPQKTQTGEGATKNNPPFRVQSAQPSSGDFTVTVSLQETISVSPNKAQL